jgi:hypothetical protein
VMTWLMTVDKSPFHSLTAAGHFSMSESLIAAVDAQWYESNDSLAERST